MTVYRVAKSAERARDLSGYGAFKFGGRWNSKGAYMLYASANSSLAYLENLVHFSEAGIPPHLFVAVIEFDNNEPVFELPDADYPNTWQATDNAECRHIGDLLIQSKKFIACKVRSAVNPLEYNFLLNPLFPGYSEKVQVMAVEQLKVDVRLI